MLRVVRSTRDVFGERCERLSLSESKSESMSMFGAMLRYTPQRRRALTRPVQVICARRADHRGVAAPRAVPGGTRTGFCNDGIPVVKVLLYG